MQKKMKMWYNKRRNVRTLKGGEDVEHQESKSKMYRFDSTWLKFMPIILLIGVVPLMVRLVLVDVVDPEAIAIWNTTSTTDLFSQFKASLIVFLVGVILIVSFFIVSKAEIKSEKHLKIIYGALGVYSIFTIISTMLSSYKQTAMWGAVDRSEGGVMLIAYIIILLYTLYVVKEIGDYRYITFTLVILASIQVILGYFQYIGEDVFLNTMWGQRLIIPEKYAAYRSGLKGLYEEKRAYGTLFHYNYVGSFTALTIPLFGTLCLFIKGWQKKLIYGIGLISSIFFLFFSTSRAGIVALVVYMLILGFFCFKIIIRKWKLTLPLFLAVVVGILSLNMATKGQLFERIPSLLQDAVVLFLPSSETTDYKAYLPIQDVTHEDKRAILWMNGHQLKMEVTEEGLDFKDEYELTVESEFVNNAYTFQDERFNALQIEKVSNKNKFEMYWKVKTNYGYLLFKGNTASSIHLVDSITLEEIELEEPESIGFKGKERIGSARGYIWSRSLPILRDNLLIGVGPDSFVYEFPQYDYLGKMYAYGTSNMIVDKPHNLYLQIGINQGGIALLSFLVVVSVYIVQSTKLYALRSYYQERHIVGMALMLAVVSYLVAGVFNDSVVSVAPIFWTILGSGMAINFLNIKIEKKERSERPYATISMKSRQHIQ